MSILRVTPWVALAVIAALCAASCRPYPTRPSNRNPKISSVIAFPSRIGQGDSLLIAILASDSDGDSLVYDWLTDARLIIKSAPSIVYQFNSSERSKVIYRSTHPAIQDTAWVECGVRDGRGGAAYVLIRVLLED